MSERIVVTLVLTGLLGAIAAAAAIAEPPVTDPTIPPGVPDAAGDPVAGPSFKLRSTQVSATSASAVINDRVVTPGSQIGGATVISIEPGRVKLRHGAELITLRITVPQVKRPANGDDS